MSNSAYEDDDDNTLNPTAEVSLCSNLYVGIQGESAYEIWLRNGFSGTENDFIEWLRQPAESAAEIVDAAERIRQQAENDRVNAEDNRLENEKQRLLSEQTRQSAETLRDSAEVSRVEAETERVSEFSKLKSESETATKNAQDAADIAAVNILAIDIDPITGIITATTGGENSAFVSGEVDPKTGEIKLNFNYN